MDPLRIPGHNHPEAFLNIPGDFEASLFDRDIGLVDSDIPDVNLQVMHILAETFPGQNPRSIEEAHEKLIRCFSKMNSDFTPRTSSPASDSSISGAVTPSSSVHSESDHRSFLAPTAERENSKSSSSPWISASSQSSHPSPGTHSSNTEQMSESPRVKTGPARWTPKEDDQLREAVKTFGAKKWKLIAHFVDGRDHVQCLQRWSKVLQPGLVKGKWTKKEDLKLISLLTNQDSNKVNWLAISEHIPGRTAKQCRERWRLNLDPTIDHSPFTAEEDERLLALHKKLGNKWTSIQSHFLGRTENSVKTRYKALMRSNAREWSPEEDEKLLSLYNEYCGNWQYILKNMDHRQLLSLKSRHQLLTCSSHWTLEHEQELKILRGRLEDDWDEIAKVMKVWYPDTLRMIALEGFPASGKYNHSQSTASSGTEHERLALMSPEWHIHHDEASDAQAGLDSKRKRMDSCKKTGLSSLLILKAATKLDKDARVKNLNTATTVASSGTHELDENIIKPDHDPTRTLDDIGSAFDDPHIFEFRDSHGNVMSRTPDLDRLCYSMFLPESNCDLPHT